MRSHIKLGRILGIQIGIHYSWFLIAFLIVLSLYSRFHMSNGGWSEPVILAMAVGTGILFFVFLLLHELSHSLFAKSHGIPVREITLFALGGVSQIEKNPDSAKSEFWMALVGPLTSAALGAMCLLVRLIAGAASSPAYTMLSWLGYINLAQPPSTWYRDTHLTGGVFCERLYGGKAEIWSMPRVRRRGWDKSLEGYSSRWELSNSLEALDSAGYGSPLSAGSYCKLPARASWKPG